MKKPFNRFALFGGAILMAAAASIALDPSTTVEYKFLNTQNFPDMNSYFDYSKPQGTHNAMPTFTTVFTPNAGSVGARYLQFYYQNTTTTGYCLEINTMANNLESPADPIMWIKNGAGGGMLKLADDVTEVRFPNARLWLQGTAANQATGQIYLAAYNTASNNQDLYYKIRRIVGATEASCTTGQNLPWGSLKGNVLTRGNNF